MACEKSVPTSSVFSLGTRVLMATGEVKAIEDIQKGEYVIGDDSFARRVARVETMSAKLHKVLPKIGESVLVGSENTLTLVQIAGPRRGLTVEMTVEEYMGLSIRQRSAFNWYRALVDFQKARHSACLQPERRKCSFGDMEAILNAAPTDEDILAYLHGLFANGDVSEEKCKFAVNVFQHTHLELGKVDIALLNKLLQNGAAVGGHVPKFVKYGNIGVRAEYLAGVLDTASYNRVTKRFDVVVNGPELCTDLLFVANSLGYYSSHICNTRYDFVQRKLVEVHVLYIYPNTNTCMPSRIFDIMPIKTQFSNIFSTDFVVETVPSLQPAVALTLESDATLSKRFLLADFSVVQ